MIRTKYITTMILAVLSFGIVQSQNFGGCEKVFEAKELTKEPGWGNNNEGFGELVNSKIIGVLTRLKNESDIFITSFKAKMEIGSDGKVKCVEALTKVPKKYKIEIEELIKNSQIWEPGEINGKKVCSEFTLYISCIKWAD
ncbi:MAG: hypothetical protein H6581_16360 [Bacteroidia bacterium]|nr:hypothetical protein [Bacteroidia bacterium]